jgi:RNA polymerase sigma-70 factor (ECF subfamily)
VEDRELIQRCIAKDEAAWGEFLKTHGPCIYGSIAALLARFSAQEPEIAEDIFASVLEKLLINDCAALKRFKWNSKVSTWLVSIARNKTYDYLRGLKRKPTISLSTPIDDGEDALERVIAADLDLDHELETRLSVDEALGMLKPKDRLILKLHYIEGMKDREIGELLDLSVDAVSARKSRALKHLRTIVRKDNPRTSY